MDLPKKNRAIIAISLLIIAFDIIAIGAWLLKIPFLQNMLASLAALNINAVLCVALFGSALFFVQNRLMTANFEQMIRERSADFEKSEEKYHSLIEHASDAIYLIDSKRNFIQVNES